VAGWQQRIGVQFHIVYKPALIAYHFFGQRSDDMKNGIIDITRDVTYYSNHPRRSGE
jgi:hypothetical protein